MQAYFFYRYGILCSFCLSILSIQIEILNTAFRCFDGRLIILKWNDILMAVSQERIVRVFLLPPPQTPGSMQNKTEKVW